MSTSKTKGQISVEALIIVGVLVIGGVIFASLYISNINSRTDQANELSGITDDFMNDLDGWETNGNGTTTTVTTETCSDGVLNQGEISVDCGGPCPLCDGVCPCAVAPGQFSIFDITAVNAPVEVNNSFSKTISYSNGTTFADTEARIKKITIEDSDHNPSSNCSYNSLPANSTYDSLNLTYIGNNRTLNFSCSLPGSYYITIYSGIDGETDSLNNASVIVTKEVTPATVLPLEFMLFSGATCGDDNDATNGLFTVCISEKGGYSTQVDKSYGEIQLSMNMAGTEQADKTNGELNLYIK